MKRHGNLWDKIISPENLEVAFEKAARGKKWQSKVQKALRDKVVLLEQLHIALKIRHSLHHLIELKESKTYYFRLHLKLEELEKRIGDYDMKGFPKKLNSKEDYYYIKEHFEESQWKPKWEALLSNRKNWFAAKTLKEGAKGRTDSSHYVETYKNDDDTEVTVQYELRDDISSDFFRYHFTEEEVQEALK